MYIEAPLLLRIQATPQFAIDVGPTVAFNVSASIGASDGDNSASADIPSDYVSAVEVGAVVGVRFAVMPNLEVNVRAAMGFMDMLDMKKMMMGEDAPPVVSSAVPTWSAARSTGTCPMP